MKRFKMGLFALVSIAGVASAFSSTAKQFAGTTYYAVTDGAGSFRWTKVVPPASQFHCDIDQNVYCTIHTNGGLTLVNGVKPTSGFQAIRSGLYVRN